MNQLQARLRAIGETRPMMDQVAREGVAEAKRLVPRRTSNLARTIRVERVTDDVAAIIAGGSRQAGYAAVVELGSRPHVIRPRRKRVLMFSRNPAARRLSGSVRTANRRSGEGVIFARIVHHPGTRPQPYLVPGLQNAASRIGLRGIVAAWNGAA